MENKEKKIFTNLDLINYFDKMQKKPKTKKSETRRKK